MDARFFGFDNPLISTAINHLLDTNHDLETDNNSSSNNNNNTRKYVRDARAMAATPADVKELPTSYSFIVDIPGVKSGEIKVQVEDDNVLVISAERKREEEEVEGGVEGGKWLRMERRMGKFMRKFVLPENANLDGISAVSKDGVLTVTVQKKPPPEPKKPKNHSGCRCLKI